jgi:hypothetical protein
MSVEKRVKKLQMAMLDDGCGKVLRGKEDSGRTPKGKNSQANQPQFDRPQESPGLPGTEGVTSLISPGKGSSQVEGQRIVGTCLSRLSGCPFVITVCNYCPGY